MSLLRTGARAAAALVLVAVFAVPQGLLADTHVVSPSDLQQQLVQTTQDRQQNLNTVRQFLSGPTAEKAMRSASMDPQQVQKAVSSLSDQELANLAQRADKANHDFAAGNLSDRDLIWIILAIAVLVLIIVAVH
ncbi:MAG TPA: PA2779 family protein [Terriglobales bacterium]|nr:PA2779 family protein [Terriglobales bacterium]